MIRHLFWDFDGTLYDSYPEVLRSFQRALADLQIGGLFAGEELMGWLKLSVFDAATCCGERSGVAVQSITSAFARYHAQDMDFAGYPHLRECLETLHQAGFRHYLYTHRDRRAVDKLKQDGLWPLFSDAVLRTDGFPDKPAPDALLALMKRNGLTPRQCAMIGDRPIDVEAGRKAGMEGVLFDPEGFYADYPVKRRFDDLLALAQDFLKN